MERTDDRTRADVVSPTGKILAKVRAYQRISSAEKAHLTAWIKGKRHSEPGAPKWIALDMDIRNIRTSD